MKLFSVLLLSATLLPLPDAGANDASPVALPAPNLDGGKPLMQALKHRRTTRDFSPAPLPLPVLSELLWAGAGINRPETGHRTVPSAMNSQEVDVYVATAGGLSIYEPKAHVLQPVAAADIRARTGGQEFVKIAPVALIYVADYARMKKPKPEDRERYAMIDAGFMVQNVYLYCASAGLAAVVHETDREGLREALRLRPDQQVLIAQAVGFPQAAPATQPSN